MYNPHFFYMNSQTEPFTPHLIAVWDVACGDGHSYTRTPFDQKYYPQDMFSLVRVGQGEGSMKTAWGTVDLPAGTLLLIPAREIVSYTAVSPVWVYHWYNFTAREIPPFFTSGKAYSLDVDKEEQTHLESMFLHQVNGDPASNALVNALFSLQYFTWVQRLEHQELEESPYHKQMQQALSYIQSHLNEPISIEKLARELGMSSRHFRTVFSRTYGRSPKTYQQYARLKNAAALLKSTDSTIGEIADHLGYYSQFQLSRDFKKVFGRSPSTYRQEQKATLPCTKNDSSE